MNIRRMMSVLITVSYQEKNPPKNKRLISRIGDKPSKLRTRPEFMLRLPKI